MLTTIALSINHLNAKGIYRLDLKPSKLFISKQNGGKLYLSINDLRDAIDTNNHERLNTSFGTDVGTLPYFAPE